MINKRNVALDIFRVLIMFMIVLGHTLVHGGILEKAELFTPTYYVVNSLMIFLYVHVNCFVIMSGYLGYQKKFSWTKWIKMWSGVLFWSVVLFFLISNLTGQSVISKELIKSFMPFTQERYWFMTTYLLMYMLTPLINAAIRELDQISYRRILIICFMIYIVLQNVIFWRNFTKIGNSDPFFFCFLYMIGAYFAKYPLQRRIPWVWIYIGTCVLKMAYFFGVSSITVFLFSEPIGETVFNGYCSVLTVIGATALFMTFATINIEFKKNVSHLFSFLSPLTLGVYLIHDNPSVREPLWEFFDLTRFINSGYLIVVLFASATVIFVVCIVMEWIRSEIFIFMKLDEIILCIGNRIDRFLEKICHSGIQKDN